MKRDLVQVVFSLFLLTTSATVMAEESHRWETATVISQNIGPSVMGECSEQVGGGSVAAPTNRKSNTVVVDIGRYRYSLQELTGGSNWNHFIVLTGHDRAAHEQVKFYRVGQSFVVLDNQVRSTSSACSTQQSSSNPYCEEMIRDGDLQALQKSSSAVLLI